MTLDTITFEQDQDLPDVKSLHQCIALVAPIVCPQGKAQIESLQASFVGSDVRAWPGWTVASWDAHIDRKQDWSITQALLQEAKYAWTMYAGQKRSAYTPSISYDADAQRYIWTMPVWSDISDSMRQVAPWLEAIAKAYRYPITACKRWINKELLRDTTLLHSPPKTWLSKSIAGTWASIRHNVGSTTVIKALEWSVPSSELMTFFVLWENMFPWSESQQSYHCMLHTPHIKESWPNLHANAVYTKAPIDILLTLDDHPWRSITGVVECNSEDIEASMPFFWQNESFEIRLVVEADTTNSAHQSILEQLRPHVSLID